MTQTEMAVAYITYTAPPLCLGATVICIYSHIEAYYG